MKKLGNKVAVVTGGSSGIGRTICLEFARNGAKIVLAARNEERSNQVVDEIKAMGGEAVFVKTDVMREDDIKNLMDKAVETFGSIDVLVNNAGIAVVVPLEQVTSENWDEVLNSNLKAPFFCMKYAIPHLLKSKGSIVTISSYAGVVAGAMQYAYSSSKAGVAMLTKVFAKEYADRGVRANIISPGVVQTPILSAAPQETLDAYAEGVPLKRIGQTEDIASAALFLACDDSSWMTGQNMCIDGGSTLL